MWAIAHLVFAPEKNTDMLFSYFVCVKECNDEFLSHVYFDRDFVSSVKTIRVVTLIVESRLPLRENMNAIAQIPRSLENHLLHPRF